MKRKIVWEKWVDPLLTNLEETEWPGYDLDEDDEQSPVFGAKKTLVTHTPFGMVSIIGPALMSSYFDFWVMHTNFDITKGFANIIEKIPGVEVFEVYTRYRARVGMPKSGLFNPSDVMAHISNVVSEFDREIQLETLSDLPSDLIEKTLETRDNINKQYDNWAILILPNGNLEVITSDKMDDAYIAKLQTLSLTCDAVGGTLLTPSEPDDLPHAKPEKT